LVFCHRPDQTRIGQRGDRATRLNRPGRRTSTLWSGTRWLDHDVPDLLSFARDPGFVLAVNFGPGPAPLPAHREILLASGPVAGDGALPPDTAVWLSA
jgi:alpha-glucosidase